MTTAQAAAQKSTYRIAVIPGDGIGKEVMGPGVKALQACAQKFGFNIDLTTFDFASCDYYEKHGKMLPDDWVEVLAGSPQKAGFDAIYFGAVGDPQRVPDHISLWESLLKFRRKFDLYVNLRPVRLIPGVPCPLSRPGTIDYWIIRENTEGEYSDAGGRMFAGTEREIVVQETIMTRTGVDRVLKYAFEAAQRRPRKLLTSATKSNGISITMPFWDERVAAMSKQYPDVTVESYHIDALAAHLVGRPGHFVVIVASNLFGDILSDLGPATTGSLGLAASGNINPTGQWPSLFEPVHGSAPDIMGKKLANPIGQLEAGSLMLRHLGQDAAADAIVSAINLVLARGTKQELTRDLGGTGGTDDLGDAIIAAINQV